MGEWLWLLHHWRNRVKAIREYDDRVARGEPTPERVEYLTYMKFDDVRKAALAKARFILDSTRSY